MGSLFIVEKLFKILSITSILLITTATCWATQPFYGGVSLGPEHAQFRQKAHIVSPGFSDVIDKTRVAGKGIFGSIFVGVQKYFTLDKYQDNFYIAGELNVDISSTAFKSSNDEFIHAAFNKARYASRHSVGLSVLPGFTFNCATLFYARLGGLLRNFRIRTTEITLPNTTKNYVGFRYGLGVNQCLTDRFALRLEYSQALYKKIKITGKDSASNTTKNTTIAPETQKFEIGLIYYFG